MPPDAAATRARLLRAALDEFAEYGLAGARVDRIAANARANKRLIYAYFGNKEELFEIVVDRSLGVLADAVPFTADDLPGYAGALFDYLVAHPQLLRLTTWRQLERVRPATAEIDAYRPKAEAVERAQRAGVIASSAAPADLLALVFGLVGAWFTVSPAVRALAPEGAGSAWSDQRLAAHRAVLVDAVRGLLAGSEVQLEAEV